MKGFIVSSMFLAMSLVWLSGISPYIRLASYEGPMKEVVGQVETMPE